MKTNGEQIVATKKLGPLTYLGYAAGDAGNNLAFAMFGMFLLLYYTDVAGITAAAAGTLFLAVRAFDAFTDIFAGRIVDRTSTRWGKFRPFLLFGSGRCCCSAWPPSRFPLGGAPVGDSRMPSRPMRSWAWLTAW